MNDRGKEKVDLNKEISLLNRKIKELKKAEASDKQAQTILREKSEELDRYFTSCLDLLCIANIDGRFIRLNPEWEKALGYSLTELEGRSFLDFVHPDDMEMTLAAISKLSTQHQVLSFENRYICKDDSYRWIEWRSHPRGELIYAAARDVTERKRTGTALEAAIGSLKKWLKFESLLAELSADFVNLSADQMDSAIKEAQRKICEHLDLDRSTLWQVSDNEPEMLLLAHIHQPQGSALPPDKMNAREFFPLTTQKVLNGETIIISKLTDLPPEADRDRVNFAAFGTKSTVLVPLSVGAGKVFGLLGFAVMRDDRIWPEEVVKGFKLIAQVFANALARKQMEEQLRDHVREIEGLKQRLEKENVFLQEEISFLVEHVNIVGQNAEMKKILAQTQHVARTDSTVLILGETGTGKELLARAIHSMSLRKDRSLITINCASLPPTLIESELFGREKGAYTGALTRMVGRFEIADRSTLFLDEIGELPLDLQSKLLRVLEDGTFERLGSTKPLHVNVRIIAATNRDIEKEMKDGKFRRDLFYRLNVFPIKIPPLRERPDDIPLLVWVIVQEFQKRMGRTIESIPKRTMQALQSYSWPGNVRELRNVIEHAMILNQGKILDISVPKQMPSEADATDNLQKLERMHIVAVLERTGWRISGQSGAADILGLKRTTLEAKMKKLSIKRPNK